MRPWCSARANGERNALYTVFGTSTVWSKEPQPKQISVLVANVSAVILNALHEDCWLCSDCTNARNEDSEHFNTVTAGTQCLQSRMCLHVKVDHLEETSKHFITSAEGFHLPVCVQRRWPFKDWEMWSYPLKACRGIRRTGPLVVRWRWGVSFTSQPLCHRSRNVAPTELEFGWAPEPVWIFQSREKVSCSCWNSNPDPSSGSLVRLR